MSMHRAGRRNEKRRVRGAEKGVRGAWHEIMAWLPRWRRGEPWWLAIRAAERDRAEAGPAHGHT